MYLYIRTAEGATYEPPSLEEALKQFVSDDGYRLSIREGNVEIIIRRNSFDVNTLNELEASATVTYRNHS